ncbi:MAG: DUF4376 domain-containing protein [Desulfovibrio sp.]|nr:DUF4376 domain-containing protein [Desulfovibrio sp.]
MSYSFRTTTMVDNDTYLEDRGCPHEVRRGDADFAALEKEFGSILASGQTAMKSMEGEGWDVIDGCPILDEAKARKLVELHDAWLAAEADGVVYSNVGFAIDANERANRDLEGLISSMEAGDVDKATFCAADNSFHEVTLDQLKTMRLEVIAHGQALYARKWELRSGIENAATFDALNAVQISFADV